LHQVADQLFQLTKGCFQHFDFPSISKGAYDKEKSPPMPGLLGRKALIFLAGDLPREL
jgi:hypothetical protein